jgi:hypothetical protein
MMQRPLACLIVISICLAAPTRAMPAQAPAMPSGGTSAQEAALVATAWADLARGDIAAATGHVADLKRQFPRSPQILWLDLDVAIAVGGSRAALDVYDDWRNTHHADDLGALRRVSTAVLYESARASHDPAVRLGAVSALAADGDPFAQDLLNRGAVTGPITDAAELAATGDQAAAKRVASALATPVPNKIALVNALVASKSPEAIPALVAMLNDPRPEHQAAAAKALGALGARDQAGRLRAMLDIPNAAPYVKVGAAAGLVRLNDDAGVRQLQEWLHSPVAAMRATAAEALEPRRDANWDAIVRELASESDPLVRLQAAKLLAPSEPELARTTLDGLAQNAEPTIRDMANQAIAADLPADLPQLMALLRSTERVRVEAARRILDLSR